jgi:hypothetical protein
VAASSPSASALPSQYRSPEPATRRRKKLRPLASSFDAECSRAVLWGWRSARGNPFGTRLTREPLDRGASTRNFSGGLALVWTPWVLVANLEGALETGRKNTVRKPSGSIRVGFFIFLVAFSYRIQRSLRCREPAVKRFSGNSPSAGVLLGLCWSRECGFLIARASVA